jgi:hypothetical protein
MNPTTRRRILVTVQSDDAQVLEEFRSVLNGAGETVGKVAEQPSVIDFRFDPVAASETVLGVLGAINTIGGVVKLIAWVKEQLLKSKEKPTGSNIIIKIGETTILLKDNKEDEIVLNLKKLLKVEDLTL